MPLLDELGETAAPPWGQAMEALNDVLTARDADCSAKLSELSRIVRKGAEAAAIQADTWTELRKSIALKAKLAEQEQKCSIERNALIAVSMMMAFAQSMLFAVKAVIGDGEQLRQVQQNVLRLLPRLTAGSPRWRRRMSRRKG
jgi:hypothetical protein